jgi:hypothetical protein
MKHRRGIDLLVEDSPIDRFGGFSLNQIFEANRAAREVTFGDLPQWYAVGAKCGACGRRAWLDRWELQRIYGADMKVIDSQRRLRCKGCGRQGLNSWFFGRMQR